MKHASTVLALLVAFGVVWLWNWFDHSTRQAEPAENWFMVRNIYVADFEEGNTKAPVVYDREIRRPFTGSWVAEVHPVSRQETLCAGQGTARYEPSDQLPETGVSLDWYLQAECILPPGQYIIKTYWTLKPANYPEKEVTLTSNVFNVYPKGAQPYVTQQQLEILQPD